MKIKNVKQQRTWKRPRWKYQKRKQFGGFLNWYDFAYASRATVNQLSKIAPGLIKNTSSEINNIAQQRINQIISKGGKEIKRVLPNIFREPSKMFIKHPFEC